MSALVCPICIENFNKSTRIAVRCGPCGFTTCRSCVETYLLGSAMDPHCMSCRVEWTETFTRENMAKTFMSKTYKSHREKILLDREKSMLPAAQNEIEKKHEIKKIGARIQEMRNVIRSIEKEIEQEQFLIQHISNGGKAGDDAVERRQYIRGCPVNDCRGFLSSQFKCGTCQLRACRECHAPLDEEEHKCDPVVVESIKFLEKDSKPCPGCGAVTFKIDGCNSIWCTVETCHTSWDWKTGRIEKGQVHNPHYFEWMRKNAGNGAAPPRAPGDVRCGGLVNLNDLIRRDRVAEIPNMAMQAGEYRYFQNTPVITITRNSDARKIQNLYRHIVHIQRVELPRFRVPYNPQSNLDLRVQFLEKQITEDRMKVVIQQRHKKFTKNRLVGDIMDTFVTVTTDIINRYVEDKEIKAEDALAEANEIKKYCNGEIDKLNMLFNCKLRSIE